MLFKNKVSRLAKNPLLLLTGKVACSKQVRQIQQFIQRPHTHQNHRGPMKDNRVTCKNIYNWLRLQFIACNIICRLEKFDKPETSGLAVRMLLLYVYPI